MPRGLKKARLMNLFTQQDAADFLDISLRSYKSYENDEEKAKAPKYKKYLNKLMENCYIDEDHGILRKDEIALAVKKVLKHYDVKYCYLFGSYAKGKAQANSDVDLLISTGVKGIKYYGLVEKLRNELRKRVDLLDTNQLVDNKELMENILTEGIKIYG